uniref:EGF-like domain-containing protein n=1 Tax=Elaeophora elaphi TaxID=1147741 RepID=A0A0R3S282_9BILA
MVTPNEANLSLESDDKYEIFFQLTTKRTTTVTITDGNFSMPSKPGLQSTPKVGLSENVGTKNDGIHFSDIMMDSLEYLKKMLGLTPDCLNGGMKTLRGECICPKFYRGHLCEELICVNNGTLVKIPKLVPTQYTCKCPHPEYIHGQHCEHVKCLNGGRPMDNGHCKCLDSWYTGQFCQEYAASWGVVLGLPLLCLVIIVICCVVCRLDLFPRKPVHSRRHRRAQLNGVCGEGIGHRRRVMEMRRGSNRTGNEIYLRMQAENILNDNDGESLVLRPQSYFLPSYIIQLDATPTLSTNANSSKPFDPPPSYEEAIATFSASQQLSDRTVNGATVLPPEYTSCPYPLLLRSRSPNISRNS